VNPALGVEVRPVFLPFGWRALDLGAYWAGRKNGGSDQDRQADPEHASADHGCLLDCCIGR
jgi:hypothetical protein